MMLLAVSTGVAQNATPVNVPTWRYDNTHQGQNTQETLLTPANVNTASFGKLFSLAVDGYVYAQPLYMSGLTMPDGFVHNVLFVATEHDSVYAFDADSNGGTNAAPLWHASLLSTAYGAAAGAATVTSGDVGTQDVVPEIGITSTPAINAATNTLYVVSKTQENGNYVQRLHALNIITGAEQANSPVVISGSVPGTGNGSSGGQLAFSPLWQMNRVAVNYNNGYVYLAFGAHGDNGPWHGWVFAYNATTLAQTGVICLSPNGFGNGVWASGAGMPIDAGSTAGRMYVVTGNGSFDGYPPISQGTDFGNSIVQLDLANGSLTATDDFTPFNTTTLTSSDTDQGSGGILQLPDQQGAYQHGLLQSGKNGTLEVVNRDNLGGYAAGASSNTNILQDIKGATQGLWSTPAYWNNNVYTWGSGQAIKLFQVNSGVVTPTPASQGTVTSYFPGASIVVSANGTQNGIAWAVRSDAYINNGQEILYAYDATNVSSLLYESDTNTRDSAGSANKFVVPVVTNGKVYVGAAYQVSVYGLLNGETATASPVITPGTGNYTASVNVTITSATPNSVIYYTTDGSTPTTASSVYTGAITISTDTVINAIASATGYLQSAVASATFTYPAQTPPVSFIPAAGTYAGTQSVALADTDTSATIHYTTDGSVPTAASAIYAGPISVSASSTINAIAVDGTRPASNVASSAYVITSSGSVINFGSGFASVAGLTLNGNAKNSDDSRLQLTDGGTYEASSVYYSTPVNIQAFTTNFSFQLSDAQADGFTFVIQNAGLTALGSNGGGLGYGGATAGAGIGQSVAIKFDFYNNAGEGTDSTGLFTNGAYPTVPFIDLTPSGIQLSSGDSIQAQLTYNGTVLTLTLNDVVVNKTFTQQFTVNIPQIVGGNTAYVGFTGGAGGLSSSQKILSWTYASSAAQTAASAPTFTPAGGSFTAAQSVSLASNTAGATIYYTINGTTPTTSSTTYSGPIAVAAGTTTINAIATASGVTPSSVSSATYVITPVTPAPVFSPAGGSYKSTQSVSITDSGAVVYYTTNGTTPTTSSAVYSGPLNAPVGTTTIKAIAVAPSSSQSAVATATYVVSNTVTPSPTFTPAAGSYKAVQNVGLADSMSGAVIYYTTNGTTPTTSSAVYTAPLSVGAGTTTIKALAQANGSTASAVVSATYVVTLPVTATPTFTPAAGSYTGAQSVTIADATAGAVIYYTTNGTTPTTSSSIYSNSIPVGAGKTTVEALALAPGATISKVATAAYTITLKTAVAPTFSPAAGTYSSAQNVTISDGTPGTIIYYTTNGTAPTTASAVYSGPVSVSATETLEAMAVASGYLNSTTTSGLYTINAVTPLNYPSGFTSTAGLALNGSATVVPSSSTLQLTSSAGTQSAGSAWYATPVNTNTFTTDFTFQMLNPVADGMTFTIQNQGPTALGANGGGLGYAGMPTSVALKFDIYNNNGEGIDSIGAYADGASPTQPSTDLTGTGIVLTSGHIFHEHIVYNGSTAACTLTDTVTGASYSNSYPVTLSAVLGTTTAYVGFTGGTGGSTVTSNVLSWTFSNSIAQTAAEPKLSPAPGTYPKSASVALKAETPESVVHYTVDGSQPNASSAIYHAPIVVMGRSLTIKAYNVTPGKADSAVVTGTYQIK